MNTLRLRDVVACITCECGSLEFRIEKLEDGEVVLGCANEDCSGYMQLNQSFIDACAERLLLGDAPMLVS
jgi:hypothetical protein